MTAVNLAAALAQMGNRVLIADLDPQACTTWVLNGEPDADRATVYHLLVDRPAVLSEVAIHTDVERLDLAPSNMLLAGAELELIGLPGTELRLAGAFTAARDKYDLCVIDCPPSLGTLTLNALVASTDVIVPVHVDPYALECVKHLLQTVTIIRRRFHRYCAGNLRILLTCVDDRTVLGRQVQQQMRRLLGDLVFRTVIHRTITLSEALAAGEAAITYAPASTGAAEYMRLAEEWLGCEQEPKQMLALAEVALMAQGALSQRRTELGRPSIAPASDVSHHPQEKPQIPGPQTDRAREKPQVPERKAPGPRKPPAARAETPAVETPPRRPPEGPPGTAPRSSEPAASKAPEPKPERAVSHSEHRGQPAEDAPPSRTRKIVLCLAFVAVLAASLVTIVLAVRNKPPIANPGSAAAQEDTPLSIRLTGAAQDPLTYRIVGGPSHGRLSGSPPDVVYTPMLNYHGSDDFTFIANDGTRDSAPATISIQVAGTDDAPVADSQSVTAEDNKPTVVTLTGRDVDGDALEFTICNQPEHGALTLDATFRADRKLVYTPKPDFTGPDSFAFKVNDGKTDSALATVSVNVIHVNHPPAVSDRELTTDEDTPLLITLAATDPEGAPLSYTITAGPANGALAGVAPELRYIPRANFHGTDTFAYDVSDGEGGTAAATVSIRVSQVNDAPTITSVPVPAAATRRQYACDVNAIDPDEGDELTYSLVEKPAGMSVDPTSGRIEWTPTSDQVGSHHVVVKVTDSDATPASDTQSFFVAVGPPSPQKATLTASGGYDQRSQKTLSIDGDIRKVQTADDTSLETQAGFYTVYSFSNASIPPDAEILSAAIYVKHFEAPQFPSGKLEWSVGTGWPDNPVSWASVNPSVYAGKHNKGTLGWNFTSSVNTPDKINSLQLQIKNNCAAAQIGTFVDCVYLVVQWQ